MAKALDTLRDIHLPAPISWWPPAPGVVIICTILLIVSCFLVCYCLGKKTRQIKKMALQQLSSIASAYHHHRNTSKTVSEISILLKQVALAFYPRTEVAALQGETWILFLSKTSKNLDFKQVQNTLLHLAYAAENKKNAEVDTLFNLSQRWIKQRSKRCLS